MLGNRPLSAAARARQYSCGVVVIPSSVGKLYDSL